MNPRVYKLIICSMGALAGAVLGYIVGEIIIYQIEKEILKEDNEKGEDNNLIGTVVEGKVVESPDSTIKIEPFEIIPSKDGSKIAKKKKRRRNYSKFSEKQKLADLVKQYEGTETPTPVDTNKPHIISNDEYLSNDEFVAVEMSYYNDDDILTDEDDKVVNNIENLIGDALNHFGEKSNDEDIVYVCNEKIKKVFEITRIHNSYAKLFLGIEPIENKKGVSKLKNKNDNDED